MSVKVGKRKGKRLIPSYSSRRGKATGSFQPSDMSARNLRRLNNKKGGH
tara:strand:+ start:101 stop:247 length:147 start_codon:yes stop_codon:yes gene_type:complete